MMRPDEEKERQERQRSKSEIEREYIKSQDEKRERQERRERRRDIVLVDISEEVRSVTHQLAEEATARYLNSLQRERRGFWGFFMRGVDAIKRSMAELSRNYIYHRFYRQIEEEVRNNYNIFQRIAIEGSRANVDVEDRERMSEFLRLAVERFEENIVERFSRDIELGGGLTENEKTYLRNLIADLIRDFVNYQQIDTPEGRIRFNQELSRRVQEAINQGHLRSESFIGSADTRRFDPPEFFASNIYEYILKTRETIREIAQEENLTPEQQRQLQEYIQSVSSLDIRLGQLTSSIRTKIPTGREGTPDYTLSAVERLCLRLENIPILNRLINPLTVGLLVSIGTREGLIRIGGRGLAAAAGATVLGSLGYLTFPILTGAVTAGIFAYYRNRARFKQDVGRILREQAAGLEINDPRAQAILQRIALPGGENIRLNINNLIERLNNNDENAYIEALSRLNVEYLTRVSGSQVPQLDLFIGQGQWRSSWIERIELERAILAFESRNIERLGRLRNMAESKTNNLLNQISEQDAVIQREARREGRISGIITGVLAGVFGSAYQYLRDVIGETQLGEKLSQTFLGQLIAAPRAKERITLIEYLLGERPRLAQPGSVSVTKGAEEVLLEYAIGKEQNFTLPDNNIATFKLNEDGSYEIILSEEAKNAGWSYDPEKNKFIHTKSGISGTLIEVWGDLKKMLTDKGYTVEKVRWVDFAYEKYPPKVISWNVPPDHPGFKTEGLELSMSFRPAGNGDVIVKVPVEGVAFNNHGGRWDLSQYFNQGKLILALSPRDRTLQFEPLIIPVKEEDVRGSFAEVRIPKEVAEIFFAQEGRKVKLNGAQLTYNIVVGEDIRGKKLVSVAADYTTRGRVNIPPQTTEVPIRVNIIHPVSPRELDPGIAIPPLIGRTPRPGEYREPPLEEYREPQDFVGSFYGPYYYRTRPAYYRPDGFDYDERRHAVEWISNHGLTPTSIEELPTEEMPSQAKETIKRYQEALETYRIRNEQISGLMGIRGKLKSLKNLLEQVDQQKNEEEKVKLRNDLIERLRNVKKRLENLLKDYKFRGENPADMVQSIIERLEKNEDISPEDIERVRKRIRGIINILDRRLKREREILKEFEKTKEDELIKLYIASLNNIEGELNENDMERLFEINDIPEDKRSYKGLIEYLASQIPPMKKENRVSVFIPARLEGKNIYNCLREYTRQKNLQGANLDPNLYEIVILVNRKEGEDPDNTLEEIKRFKSHNPNFNIHVIELVLPGDLAQVGFCRRVLTDVILYRASQREEKNGPLYLITEDADLIQVDNQIVVKTIEKFEKYPHLDALRGIHIRDPKAMARCFPLWYMMSCWNVTEYLMRPHRGLPKNWYLFSEGWPTPFSWARTVTIGSGTAFRATVLTEIGGYDPNKRITEDLMIGELISILRSKKSDEQGNPIPNTKTLGTIDVINIGHPRRFLEMLRSRKGYDEYGEASFERLLRDLEPEKLIQELNRNITNNPEEFKNFINRILNWNISNLFFVTRNIEEGKRRSQILLQLFLLREKTDYRWKNEGKLVNDQLEPGEIEITDSGIKKIEFIFQIFKIAIEGIGVEEVIRRKVGLWPIISGFKSLPRSGEYENKFELIERVREQIRLAGNISEDDVISVFLNLSEDRKKEIVENLFREKYGE